MNIADSPVSIIIFTLTILISIYTIYKNQNLYFKLLLNPRAVIYEKKYYQLITSGFLHADIMHLIFNMLTFYFFGFQLESYIGSLNFFMIYFLSLLAANLFTVWKKRKEYNYGSVGASGAISGILFSFILISPATELLIFPLPFPIPSWLFGTFYLGWTYYASNHSYDRINHTAHLYGALAGIIITMILLPDVVSNIASYFM